uniref:Uncharacterized protein n=1 Tax=viral metagenome TaxID=1070528 RepID=A0A6C0BMK0_9ZZZZ
MSFLWKQFSEMCTDFMWGNIPDERVLDQMMDDLRVLQADIAVMEQAVRNPPPDMSPEQMSDLKDSLVKAKQCERRAIKYFADIRAQHYDLNRVQMQFSGEKKKNN